MGRSAPEEQTEVTIPVTVAIATRDRVANLDERAVLSLGSFIQLLLFTITDVKNPADKGTLGHHV